MNKIVLLLTALAFILTLPSYGMDIEKQYNFKKKYQIANTQPYSGKFQTNNENQQPLSNMERLSTPKSHVRYMQDAISSAKKSILITSHGVDKEAFEGGNLYNLLSDATNRGVGVYIYNIDSKDTDDKTFRFFQDHGIAYDVAYTHAKLLAVDNQKFAIGSYNWLSKDNSWENATLCLSGKECKDLVPLLWEDLKYYRNIQFDNVKQIRQYKNNSKNEEIDTWDLDKSTTLYYFHSLDQHRDFIANTFQYAKKSVVFCAPFINSKSGYQEDFEWNLLSKTIKRGVHIYFACRAEDHNLLSFKKYLSTLLDSPFMHLIAVSNIHQKTVIVDDITIAEGSFNWLSASRDEESEHHNHEVTLMLNGNQSKPLIQDFYNSPTGQEIIKATSIQRPGLNRSNELIKIVEPKVEHKKRKLSFDTENSPVVEKNLNKTKLLSWQDDFKSLLKPNNFEIFPGHNFGKSGFCVRFDKKDYLVGEKDETVYFPTKKDAEEAALKLMSKNKKPSSWQKNSNNSQWQENFKSSLKKPNNFEIFPGHKFGKDGFCVRFDKKAYLIDDNEEIIYFRTEREAQKAAYECK